jgi:soluble lytic murein transglycosylase
MEAPEAEDAYRDALSLHDTVALRLELARHLQEHGDLQGAYTEYYLVLGDRPDAFAGMRRTAEDPLTVAEDLINAAWFSDALETLRDVSDPRATPLRGRALGGLGRYEEAENALRAWLRDNPEDDSAKVELAEVLERLQEEEEALSLYEELDTLDSKLARAELLEDDEPEEALDLYSQVPYPVAWWSATALLEHQGRLTETLPLYERVARSSAYFADDAAYRLLVLSQRLGDKETEAEAKALLRTYGLNWLSLRASQKDFRLPAAPALAPGGEVILDKVAALESLGRGDLAELELELAAKHRGTPEVDLAMAQALAERGETVQAQTIAAEYAGGDGRRAPVAFWRLSYPRPYSTTVQAAAKTFDLDPLLIWSVMRQESVFDAEAMSYVGARGLMQVMPSTQEWIAEQLDEDISPGEAFTPEASIRMGAWFLRFVLDYFDGDVQLALAAYNGGAGSVDSWLNDPLVSDRDDLLRWIGFGETREYLERVSLNYEVYQALYGTEGDPDTE